MTDDARDLLAEIDATLKLGRERHLDYRDRSFNLLKRLRPLVEGGYVAMDTIEQLGKENRSLRVENVKLGIEVETFRPNAERMQRQHQLIRDLQAENETLRLRMGFNPGDRVEPCDPSIREPR